MKKPNIIIIILLIILIGVSVILIFKKQVSSPVVSNQNPVETQTPKEISISSVDINEQNYSGSRPEITGDGLLADAARKYVVGELASFAKDANEQVPDMRKEFGADSPSANYAIDLSANYLKGDIYDSIIVDEYIYTGGAHGSDVLTVFTASKSGVITTLKDIINPSQQKAFLAYVKQKLFTRDVDGEDNSLVFPDSVNALTIDTITNWSLDAKNLTLYFSQYEIAAGAAGSLDLELPRAEIQKFLK
jgi:hypothetical protein